MRKSKFINMAALIIAIFCMFLYACDAEQTKTKYSVTVNIPLNGIVKVSEKNPEKGSEIKITATPNAGYILDAFKVNAAAVTPTESADGALEYVVKNIMADVVVEVTFKEIPVEIIAPKITIASLESGAVNAAYQQAITATGTAPIMWTVIKGAIPDGLTLNAQTGAVSGLPTKVGNFTFTIKATNSKGSDQKELSVEIVKGVNTAEIKNISAQVSAYTITISATSVATLQYAVSTDDFAPLAGAEAWKNSNVFTGLNPSTNYYVFVRCAETDNYKSGKPSTSVSVNTKDLPNFAFDKAVVDSKYTFDLGHPKLKLETLQIEASYADGVKPDATWASSDVAVATVTNGLITPIAIGAATITINVGLDTYTALTVTVKNNTWTEISTTTQFNETHSKGTGDLNGLYVLTADLDFDGAVALFGNSEPGSPKRALTGVFDGNGHAIKNAKVAKTSNNNAWTMGIFGHLKGGTVRNIKFENIIAPDYSTLAAGVAFGRAEANSLIENIYFETHLTHAQNGNKQTECGNSGFVGWISGGSQIKNVVAVITTAQDVTDFKNTALIAGLACNDVVGSKFTNVFVVTHSTSVTKTYCGKLGSGKVIETNVEKYTDVTALKTAQGELINSWDQEFWSILNNEYAINVTETQNGNITVNKNKAKIGESVTLTIIPNSGYELEWLKINGKNVDVVNNTYTIDCVKAQNISIEASFIFIVNDRTNLGTVVETSANTVLAGALTATTFDIDFSDAKFNDMTAKFDVRRVSVGGVDAQSGYTVENKIIKGIKTDGLPVGENVEILIVLSDSAYLFVGNLATLIINTSDDFVMIRTTFGSDDCKSGTRINPVSKYRDGYWILGANIDFTGKPGVWLTQSDVVKPEAIDKQWYATFDGRGHVLKNVNTTLELKEKRGIFGNIGEGSVVKNLGVVNATIGGGWSGGLACGNRGLIDNCLFTMDKFTGGGNKRGALVSQLQGNGCISNTILVVKEAANGNPNNYDGFIASNTEKDVKIINTYVVNSGDLTAVMADSGTKPTSSGNIYGKFATVANLITAVKEGVATHTATIENTWGNGMKATEGFSGGAAESANWGVPSFDGFSKYWKIGENTIEWGDNGSIVSAGVFVASYSRW